MYKWNGRPSFFSNEKSGIDPEEFLNPSIKSRCIGGKSGAKVNETLSPAKDSKFAHLAGGSLAVLFSAAQPA